MVISISNTSTVAKYGVATASSKPIMEDSGGYVPPQAVVVKEYD